MERVEYVLAHEGALLHPPVGSVGRADVDEALVGSTFKDIQAVTVFYCCNFVVDGGDAVAQKSLRRGNVGGFVGLAAVILAGGGAEHEHERS